MFFLIKAHWKFPNGPNSVSCWQGNKLLHQVLFLCNTQDDMISFPCYFYTGYHADQVSHFAHIHRNNPTPCHRLLPFSISFLMASSVKARWAGSALGNMLILLIEIPLHLIVMLPGGTNKEGRMCFAVQQWQSQIFLWAWCLKVKSRCRREIQEQCDSHQGWHFECKACSCTQI